MRAVWLGAAGLLFSQDTYSQIVLPTPEQFFLGVQPQLRVQRAPPRVRSEPTDFSEGEKRKYVLPSIVALTNCVLNISDSDEDAVAAYKQGRYAGYLEDTVRRCPGQITALTEVYDEAYGQGETYTFVHGNYLRSLAEVAQRPERRRRLEARLVTYNRAQAQMQAESDARAAREFRERKAEEARQQDIADREAEERRTALAKAEADRKTAEADRAAAEAKAAAQKREQVDVAKRTFGILRDKFYDCADGQLPGLVKSGEGADVLANAAMTICRQPLGQLQESALDEFSLEQGQRPAGLAEENFRDHIKSVVRDRVVADAVQAKAGVGMFAPK